MEVLEAWQMQLLVFFGGRNPLHESGVRISSSSALTLRKRSLDFEPEGLFALSIDSVRGGLGVLPEPVRKEWNHRF
jgi:hypothetical protein